MADTPRVFIGPTAEPPVVEAVLDAGGRVVTDVLEADSIVWMAWEDKDGLARLLHPGIDWVQLPSAGVDHWIAGGIIDESRTWSTASDAFAHPVAEHALALLLSAARKLPEAARSTSWDRSGLVGTSLRDKTVAVVGAGGIGRALIAMLAPLGARVIAVNRSGRPVEGVETVIPSARMDEVWPAADFVVLAAPATPETTGLVDATALAAMRPTAVLVNIARGTMVDTEALWEALESGTIAGAALDVTDPEPLPDGHPLWTHPRVLVTPHTATPNDAIVPTLAALTGENVKRRIAGEPPRGVVELQRGY